MHSIMENDKKIPVKFVVDKIRRRVVLAEADNDFVDILFSFLTLPLGTIIRLLDKKSNLGCMDKLYESVEKLDVQSFQTEACKTMLLSPRSAAAVRCEDLKVCIDDTEPRPRQVYVCAKPDCCAKETCLFSSVQNARCPHCRKTMDIVMTFEKGNADAGKLFTEAGSKFMISDDLHITPVSMAHTLSLLQKMGIMDGNVLEEWSMDLDRDEILLLLKKSLSSNAPLTNLCFGNLDTINAVSGNTNMGGMIQVKTESNTEIESEAINVELFLNKETNRVEFVEAGEEFTNLVFSFLTLPLGAVIKLLSTNAVMGCVANLYKSAENLSLEYFKSDECKSMLLSPELSSFSRCADNILMMDEVAATSSADTRGCLTCYRKNNNMGRTTKTCIHGVETSALRELNPKLPEGTTITGGGYAKRLNKFLVTNDLRVSPISTTSSIQMITRSGFSVGNMVVKNVSMGRNQTKNLLRAALISETPIADVFAPAQRGVKTERLCSVDGGELDYAVVLLFLAFIAKEYRTSDQVQSIRKV